MLAFLSIFCLKIEWFNELDFSEMPETQKVFTSPASYRTCRGHLTSLHQILRLIYSLARFNRQILLANIPNLQHKDGLIYSNIYSVQCNKSWDCLFTARNYLIYF